ncbi:3-deoxy-alpha-D-manno-octulosonate 8-oxidase [Ectothiorhodosinus mongolicus]|uniref:3-deoxy-alpha-D-manno-octulosonate 8-oxidase n=1 Tax=Ectothiorhodosinus mongolicus TaxID=233100 RepID=A0A1R3VMZ7_9GAMM|nr:iron-containing alcohol dehydrogenase family protein [Ectothiorhodosinus mongolicus]ULX56395.1 alcohol dehydrogenase [Ectothiorhodosinus mongolicus]SIT65916.1 3-deoxy-alpha-D-manno-octulosonate 8-oxidase [Ectothiorhodosinus mongolicus]
MYKNLRVVPHMVFGRGSFNQLDDILRAYRTDEGSHVVYLIDAIHEHRPLIHRVPIHKNDLIILVNVDTEPKTSYVDELVQRVNEYSNRPPDAIIGLGGGSTLDLAKAVALMLTNPGSAADYQGWDLVKNPGITHIGIPTLAGTGAEISRTTVLTGPTRKLGINSDFTPFDQIIMDAELVEGVPTDQWFYTGMDCYIHNAEALAGSFINTFAQAYAEKSLDLCRDVYLGDDPEADDKLMVASYFGGMSIAYSQVGVAHALSYGLSFLLGTRHGVGNCIVFDQLDDYYGPYVEEFRRMMDKHNIQLPRGVTKDVDEAGMEKMIDVALGLEPLWQNALGPDWKSIMTREKVRALYERM